MPTRRAMGNTMACGAAIGLMLVAFAWYRAPAEILLLDRPRLAMETPDLVLRFWKLVGKPLEFREGYLVLRLSTDDERLLLRLLRNLDRCLDVVTRNEMALFAPSQFRPAICSLGADGEIEVLDDVATAHTPEERVRRARDLSRQRDELTAQYETTLAALGRLRPGAVGKPIAGAIGPSPNHLERPVVGPSAPLKPVVIHATNEEPVEIPEIDAGSAIGPSP